MSLESGWRRQERELSQAAGNISLMRKEISKEAQIDVPVQSGIRERIEELKVGAGVLAGRLEGEKHKNMELEAIIGAMQARMEEERQLEATSKEGGGFESVAMLETRFKKLEYDLGHVAGKANRLGENVESKRSKIKQSRTERVIDSGIFRNIEKELILSELRFKKMLIEKVNFQRQYERLAGAYEEMKSRAASYYEEREGKSKVSKAASLNSQEEVVREPMQRKFVEVGRERDRKRTIYENRTGDSMIDGEIEAQREGRMIAVQKLMSHLGLDSCQELLFYLEGIEGENERIFNEINNLTDQSGEIEKYIQRIYEQKLKRRMKFYSHKEEPSQGMVKRLRAKELRGKISQTDGLISSEMGELTAFLSQGEFKVFQESMEVEPIVVSAVSSGNFQEICGELQVLEQHIHRYLRESVAVEEEQPGVTSRAACQEKLLEMLSHVQSEQCMRVMKKEEFERDYGVLLKGTGKTKKMKVMPALSNRSSSNLISKR